MGGTPVDGVSSTGSEGVHPRQNRRWKFIEYIPQGSSGWGRKGGSVCNKVVVRGHSYRTERGSMGTYGIFLFLLILGTVPVFIGQLGAMAVSTWVT